LVNGAGSEYFLRLIPGRTIFTMHGLLKKTQKIWTCILSGSHGGPTGSSSPAQRNLKSQAGKPLAGVVSVIDLDQGVEVSPKFLREDGTFDFSLINKRNYLLIIRATIFSESKRPFLWMATRRSIKWPNPLKPGLPFNPWNLKTEKRIFYPACIPT